MAVSRGAPGAEPDPEEREIDRLSTLIQMLQVDLSRILKRSGEQQRAIAKLQSEVERLAERDRQISQIRAAPTRILSVLKGTLKRVRMR